MIGNLRRVGAARRAGALVSWRSTTIDDSELAAGARVAHHASLRSTTLGRYTSIGRFAKVAFADIGAFCSVSWDVTIGAIGHPMTHLSTHAFPYVPELGISSDPRVQDIERVSIGNDVWIGTQAIIMPGVRIGNGAVIGAGSVVTHDVEAYSVVAGVPARQLRARFEAPLAARVEATEWWNWPVEQLRAVLPAFRSDDVNTALEQLEAVARS